MMKEQEKKFKSCKVNTPEGGRSEIVEDPYKFAPLKFTHPEQVNPPENGRKHIYIEFHTPKGEIWPLTIVPNFVDSNLEELLRTTHLTVRSSKDQLKEAHRYKFVPFKDNRDH